MPIQTILVPKGAEHRAVCRGLRKVLNPPTVISVPVGPAPLTRYLESLQKIGCFYQGQTILVMGVCGGLVPDLAVRDVVLYQECISSNPRTNAMNGVALPCDRLLTKQLQDKLTGRAFLVTAVTSDRVVSTVAEKQELAQRSRAEVVDMEGFASLDVLTKTGASIAMLRVISDDCHHDIPDLSAAFNADGSLNSLALTTAMFRQPIAATRLIRGSLQGLKLMQQLTFTLFQS
ncbi:MAG: phosphorylase [Leptolyngbyaceae cyanobacterium RU_5_1]|nr:phosphorylase [Leptolyngbyaceae cyanobacterium RU_5_1]